MSIDGSGRLVLVDPSRSAVALPPALEFRAVLSDDERVEVLELFASHGYSGLLRVARVRSEDERIIVLPDGVLATLHDAHGLEIALQDALQRRVLIVGDSPAWSEDAELL